ncbi:transcriptional regulator [West African Asystasia virus 1]|uniref:Transcriptional activator protein n=1 Tax=West African Asystasia virus 1 TaxID=1046573 RepID=G9CM26_9GEMI|nr:transcriptional regulator [West African Asystasia virus 1]AEI91431.1 transcriptional regulator [West African Asystasia virus 1]ALQ10785.1 AC2 [West African Asystasia virus 1]ALQ10794.1 AC2 [West African Asystasia virus 1]
MPPSYTSKHLSTPVPIKVSHRLAKKRRQRRKTINLRCGCAFLISESCTDYGFSHRGVHHCTSSKQWHIHLGDQESTTHEGNTVRPNTIQQPVQHHTPADQIQPQPEASIGTTQMLHELPSLDDFLEFEYELSEILQDTS